MQKNLTAIVAGSGAALPDQVLTNMDLERIVDTSDQWIITRTGIKERRKLEEGLSNIDLSLAASLKALENAALDPQELDLIVVATITPDYPTPSTSCLLQSRLQAVRAAALDVSAGCTGFVYALAVAEQFIKSGVYRNVLVVGVEVLSRVTDWSDRGTCVLFGDGAGAFILQAAPGERGIIDFTLKADGSGSDLLKIPAGGSMMPASLESVANQMHCIKMKGNEVFKFAVRVVEETLSDLMARNKLQMDNLDYLFLHQANLRIIEHICRRLKLQPEKVPVNIEKYGNMSSATIPIAVHEELMAGRLKDNDLIAMIAFGSGLTWGGVILRW